MAFSHRCFNRHAATVQSTVKWLYETGFQNSDQYTFLYIGAGVGSSMVPIIKSFPLANYHLYDPADTFSPELRELAEEMPNVHLVPLIFDDAEANNYVDEAHLWSYDDVRRDLIQGDVEYNSRIIHEDNTNSRRWAVIMQPEQTCLKFTTPYVQSSYGRLNNGNYIYNVGQYKYQVCARRKGTELRLWIARNELGLDQDIKITDYEGTLYWYNMRVRTSLIRNKLSNLATAYFRCRCHDCVKIFDTLELIPKEYRRDHLYYLIDEFNRSFRYDYNLNFNPLKK